MPIKNPNIIPSPYKVTTEYETDFVRAFSKNLASGIAEVLKYMASVTRIAMNNADSGDNSYLIEKAEQNPSEAQIEAGNYKKDHIKFQGLDISIENPKGSVRSGKDKSRKLWSIKMKNSYGYIRGTKGKDGDHIDVFIGNNDNSEKVFIVDQFIDGVFDEHKVMLGFNDEESAKKAYLSNYEKNWKGLKAITETTIETFKKWLSVKTKKQKPYKDYINKSIDVDIEKSHNVGDLHPNGKYIWTEYAAGKFDWRNRKAASNKLSAYTFVENCSDESDIKAGIEEIQLAMKKRMSKNEVIPSYYGVRLGKLKNKLNEIKSNDIQQ